MIIKKILYLFLIISVALIASVVFEAYYILSLSERKSEIEINSRQLYSHIYSINANMLKTKTCVKDFIISGEPKYVALHSHYADKIDDELNELRRKMEIEGIVELSNSLKNTFSDYRHIIERILNQHAIRLRELNNPELSFAEGRAEFYIKYINDIQPLFNDFIEVNSIVTLQHFSGYFRNQINEITDTSEYFVYLLIASAIVLFHLLIAFVWYIRRAIIFPIRSLVSTTEKAASGDYSHSNFEYKWHNEIAGYIAALNKLLDNLRISENSNKHFRWLQESENQLYQKLVNIEKRELFYSTLLKELCTRVSAFSASFYLFDVATEKLIYIEAYSSAKSKEKQREIPLNQGLLGEYALRQEVSILKDLPPEYYCVESSMGTIIARELAFVPLYLEAQLLGIIEIGTINSFTNSQVEYLSRAAKIAVSTLQLRQ